jgi:hypothetical protein
MSRKIKEIIRAAGLRDELSFASFRHGGFTEAGDAELTDRQIMAQGRHKSPKVLPKYVKRTMHQVAEGARKRRGSRVGNTSASENGEGSSTRTKQQPCRKILSENFGRYREMSANSLKRLERVKGVERSSSAWKAVDAAIPP